MLLSATTAPTGLEGEGFPVHRAFAGVSRALLDPFVHTDQMGAVQYAPGEPKGTPWHPHRGFETVTYMIDGRIQHQDSHGGGGMIEDGATQWMTAASGILHIETPPEHLVMSGGLFHGVQLWVNLPAKKKMIPPAYQSIDAAAVKMAVSAYAGALVRVIAGEVGGHRGPGSTHTPITLMHATVSPGARLQLRGIRPSMRSSTSLRALGAWVPRGDRYMTVSWWRSAAATGSRSAVTTTKTRKVRQWRCLSWVASQFANQSRRMGPS
jgi:redox-sensitive bicupin YhaK (pirin superfamily)